ncbi:MAG TPA: hypothetical protein VGG03_15990 [Thermoanaerobaculia bacterium]|jgi:hypothetical protein
MRKIKMMALAMGLGFTAMYASNGSAATQCEIDCRRQYNQCQVICSKNPCLVSCEYNLQICLDNCGSEM